MKSASTIRFGHLALCVALSATALTGCSKKAAEEPAAGETAAAAPAADNVDTLSGVNFAGYTGDAAK